MGVKSESKETDTMILRFRYRYEDFRRTVLRKFLINFVVVCAVMFAFFFIGFILPAMLLHDLTAQEKLFWTLEWFVPFMMAYSIPAYSAFAREIKNNNVLLRDVELTFSDEGITINYGGGVCVTTLSWEIYPKIIKSRGAYVLQSFTLTSSRNQFSSQNFDPTSNLLIPKRIFDASNEKIFLEIVKRNQEKAGK